MRIIDRAKNIIMTPKTEWAVIAGETPDANAVFLRYALPLIVLSAVAGFIGHALIWGSGHYGAFAMKWGLYFALEVILSGALGVWLTAAVINALAPNFGSEKNMGRAMQLVVYSMTPAWIGGLLMIVPPIGFIGTLFGIYGLYLLYLGIPHLMKTPEDKVVSYMVISIAILIIIYVLVIWIYRAIFWDIMGFGVFNNTGVIGI